MTDTVFGRHIFRRVEVCMERVPTMPTLEKGLRAPIRSVLAAAVRAGLRRVAWVDSHYVQAAGHGFL